MINYVKEFASFEDGINELRKLLPFVVGITGKGVTDKEVVDCMIAEIQRHFPSINNQEYPSVPAFSISSHEVGFKTSGFYSFGWKVIDNRGSNIVYSFRVSTDEMHNRISNFANFVENNWREIVSRGKNSRNNDKKQNSKSKRSVQHEKEDTDVKQVANTSNEAVETTITMEAVNADAKE